MLLVEKSQVNKTIQKAYSRFPLTNPFYNPNYELMT